MTWKMLLKVLKPQIVFRNKEILMRCIRSNSSVVNDKVAGFNDLSTAWWDPKGSMKQLHLIHPHRISFVRHQLRLKDGARPDVPPHQPLTGYKIVDVGCGVGMVSEDLALLGAKVTGLDPAENTIHAAKFHAAANPMLEGNLKYAVSTVEEHRLTHTGQYDVVISFFILEHIQNRQEFIDNCLALLKPNGSLFICSANRSFLWYCYVLWHQYVSGMVDRSLPLPYNTFVTKEEVMAMVNRGHPCELKGQRHFYWTLDGQSCRETKSKRFINLFHFVQTDGK